VGETAAGLCENATGFDPKLPDRRSLGAPTVPSAVAGRAQHNLVRLVSSVPSVQSEKYETNGQAKLPGVVPRAVEELGRLLPRGNTRTDAYVKARQGPRMGALRPVAPPRRLESASGRTVAGRRDPMATKLTSVLVLGMLLLTACGADGSGSDTTGDATHTATIRITQDQTDCCYTGGQISFLNLSNDESVVVDRGYKPAATTAVLAQVEVVPGSYTLESWQRPCSAGCPDLDEDGRPTDEGALEPGRADQCSIDIIVGDGETSNALITWAPEQGCEITLPAAQPPSDVPDDVALREVYPPCGTDRGLEDLALMPSAEPLPNSKRRCLLDAYQDGQRAELETYEPANDPGPPRHLIYRVNGDQVEVFGEETTGSGEWFRYTCSGLDEAATGYEFETTGCSEPAALS
jgi:hypothetical protein